MFEFAVSPDNPHDQDDEFFACYQWELNAGNLMRIHSNHYINEAAARTNLARQGWTQLQIMDPYTLPLFETGRPIEKPGMDIVETELGEFYYHSKPKGQTINEVV